MPTPPLHKVCHLLLLLIVGFLLARSPDAFAACPSSPENWAAADCEVDSVDVCVASGPSYAATWTCDVSSSPSAAKVNTVSAGTRPESWGTHDGELFCCIAPDQDLFTEVITYGSDHDDVLAFTFPGGYELREGSAAMVATIYGSDGDDTIKGSNRSSGSYAETLWGEAGVDDIQGNAGVDTIYGGSGNDVCDGGPGIDTIYGEGGNDTLHGNDGNDVIEGGDGDDTIRGGDGDDTLKGDADDDRISGGNGDDEIYGDAGGDVLCGDGETGGDTIVDGPETGSVSPPNLIWGANSLDDVTCNADNTQIDESSTEDPGANPCLDVLTEKPGACP